MQREIKFIKIFLLTMFIGTLFLLIPIKSNAQNVIDEIRKKALETLGPDRLGSSYAAMVNFSVHPDISTATYKIDVENTKNPTLNVYRIPLQYVFKLDKQSWRPLVRANFTYQTFSSGFTFLQGESVDSEWRTYGGSLSVGIEVPVSKNLTLVPVINAGMLHIENRTDYYGIFTNNLLKPALDGLLFNWDADAWLLGGALGVDYRRKFQKLDLLVHGSLTYNYVETFQSSSEFIEFGSAATTFNINVETVIPTGKNIKAYPFVLVLNAGYTTFLGGNRDALDFNRFFEAGLAFETDLSKNDWKLKRLRLGAKAIYGENVTGWSLVFGYRF